MDREILQIITPSFLSLSLRTRRWNLFALKLNLIHVSESMDAWEQGPYGETIVILNSDTLTSLRNCWQQYTTCPENLNDGSDIRSIIKDYAETQLRYPSNNPGSENFSHSDVIVHTYLNSSSEVIMEGRILNSCKFS
jgi:hypothetical protein